MSKIICDICGTTYPETAEQCPICGCSRDAAVDLLGEDLLEISPDSRRKARSEAEPRRKQIFDFDEVNSPREEPVDEVNIDDSPYDEDEDGEEPRQNTLVIILLTVLIAGLLLAAGFLFLRYILPNMGDKETVPVQTQEQVQQTVTETTEFTIPCQSLALASGGQVELSVGGQHLIHAIATPADTTDGIFYTSQNEGIATVTEDGKVTAVAEGQTEIEIVCGVNRLKCIVIVQNVVETEPPTTAAAETEPEGTEAVEETTAAVAASDVELKLKKSDISLGVYRQIQLELDCGLEQNQVEWSSDDAYIASVDENGLVTAKQGGTTKVRAKYGDQEVFCWVRCR